MPGTENYSYFTLKVVEGQVLGHSMTMQICMQLVTKGLCQTFEWLFIVTKLKRRGQKRMQEKQSHSAKKPFLSIVQLNSYVSI